MRIIRNIFLIAATAIYFLSCTSDECVFDTETFLITEVNVVDTNLINIGFLDSMSVYSPAWTDSIHYLEEGISGSISYSLSPNDVFTEIIITSKRTTEKDTIIFYHQSEMIFLSPECGFIFNFTIDSFKNTWNLIDSLTLVNNELTTDEEGYIQIYL
ncbi:MAG: hypothetical protein KAR57_00130 [Bacteroidales bacterium]|nr:hypothetical protein [Bacteroidales bacterium]